MMEFSTLLQQGATSAWLFIPSAILLGALHGLEPGHSKTLMAAFIVAIRGTVGQAVMLGLAATVSHTAVVWAVALLGLHFGSQWNAEQTEPYFQLASAVLIIGVALWMMWRTWQQEHHRHAHDADGHEHDAAEEIDTGHGVVRLLIHEDGVSARFRLYTQHRRQQGWSAGDVSLETERADGQRQQFSFASRYGYLESVEQIAEPHEFIARLSIGHGGHRHDFDVEFVEQGHHHAVSALEGLDLAAPGYQDPHELAHANDIRRRFSNRSVTNGQILMFGLTGGLIPCPAAITVLLLCLQLKEVTLGATLVLCFSIGLALTMVLSGAIAAISVKHASQRWRGFGEIARKAPYFSSALIILVGLYVGYHGWMGLL
jgi:nickel/cobalt exporter